MNQGPHFSSSGFTKALGQMRARRVDTFEKTATLNEAYDSDRLRGEGTAVKYAIGAMQPIDKQYTDNTYREGDRVKNQLEKAELVCDFAYQGSVTSDTHIRAHSDIDLLTLTCKFVTVDAAGPVTDPYPGNPIDDLLLLRRESITVLRARFPEASLDQSGAKCISISGGSLRRKIDVVSSNWRNTQRYDSTGRSVFRGVDVLDCRAKSTIRNLPFLHNERIRDNDGLTNGGLRKAIRLLKSLRYDAEKIPDISSYDIAAIAYTMDNNALSVLRGAELILVERCKSHLDKIAADSTYREGLAVPNGTRKIFGSDGATVKGLTELRQEVDRLLHEIKNDLQRSFRNLAAARIEY